MKRFSILLIMAILSGCSATYHPVAEDRLIADPPVVSSGQSYATVTVRRDKAFAGSALDARFHLNGMHIVTLKQAETFTFKVPPGRHKLGVKSIQGILVVPTPFYREIEVELKAENTYEYIFKSIYMGGLKIEPLERI